jgi:hypothetical protein
MVDCLSDERAVSAFSGQSSIHTWTPRACRDRVVSATAWRQVDRAQEIFGEESNGCRDRWWVTDSLLGPASHYRAGRIGSSGEQLGEKGQCLLADHPSQLVLAELPEPGGETFGGNRHEQAVNIVGILVHQASRCSLSFA